MQTFDAADSDSLSGTGSRLTQLVSIRAMVIALCLWSVATAAGVTAAVAITSYDSALSDTQNHGKVTSEVYFKETEQSLSSVSLDLLSFSSAAITDSVIQILNVAETARQICYQSYMYGNQSADKSTWEYMYSRRSTFLYTLDTLSDSGVAIVGVMVSDTNGKLVRLFHLYKNLQIGVTIAFEVDGSKGAIGDAGLAKPHDGGIQTPLGIEHDFNTGVTAAHMYREGYLKYDKPQWGGVIVETEFAGVALTSAHLDPVSGYNVMFTVSLTLPKMSKIFRELALKTLNDTGAEIYLFTVVNRDPLYEFAQKRGLVEQFGLQEQEYLLPAVSHGTNINSIATADLTNSTQPVLLRDVNATDPHIRNIARGVHRIPGTYATVEKDKNAIVVNAVGANFLVQVSSIKLEEQGLDWWLVSAIDMEFVVGETQRRQEASRKSVNAAYDDIEDQINKDKRIMIIVILAVAAVLVLFSVVIGRKMLQPLDNLKHEMRKVSEMNLETETVKTVFYEVNSMQTSFEKMVRNLKEYKAYVPTAVLEGTQAVEVPPPTGNVAVVFTDIVSSTALWARASAAMNDALEMHNTCIRSALSKYNGYEVKTIGDAFMISFSNKIDAITFCLKTQEEFVKQKWPSDLELTPQYHRSTDALPVWNGLRLRMGCHVGDAGVEENPLTGRVDYRGSTVNMAARLEAKALPGTLCISKEVHQMVKGQLSQSEAANPVLQDLGLQELKGIGKVDLVILCPASLAPRLKAKKFAYETLATPSPHLGIEVEIKTMSGNSSVAASVSDDGGRTVGRNKKTGLTLSSGLLTVAVCRLCDVTNVKAFENYNLMLRVAIDAAVQTDGVLGGVTGKTLTVVWNASKSCKLHTTSALRFASQIQWRVGSIVRVGISTGTLLHGNVGTNTQRFATAFGRPLEAAEAAADVALGLGTFAVIADCTNDCKLISNSAISPFLRMADLWLDSETNKQIAIYEVLCSALMKQLEDGWGIVTDGGATGADAHNKAFRDVLAGNAAALRRIELESTMDSNDTVVAVCILLCFVVKDYQKL